LLPVPPIDPIKPINKCNWVAKRIDLPGIHTYLPSLEIAQPEAQKGGPQRCFHQNGIGAAKVTIHSASKNLSSFEARACSVTALEVLETGCSVVGGGLLAQCSDDGSLPWLFDRNWESGLVCRHRIEARGIPMLYKKINIDLIVPADEAEAVIAGLNASLDVLEEKQTLFGGGIEAADVEHRGTRKRSALAHTLAAGETVAGAVKIAREHVKSAFRAVI
jgi:hypothetical protein